MVLCCSESNQPSGYRASQSPMEIDIQELLQWYGIPLKYHVGSANSNQISKSTKGNQRSEEDRSKVERPRSFIGVLEGKVEEAMPLVKMPPPVMEGGNVAVVLDENKYLK